ncbi:MAG: hypothetical protein KIT25_20350 [Enhydrobacter sp.]|nr:MAG: hypothetical protein KIT25_20350 [Enhydrobacter sp.]
MQRNHVPQIDRRYWLLLWIATVFGSNAGDLLNSHLIARSAAGVDILVIAALFGVVLLAERHDRSSSHLLYWLAICLIPMMSNELATLSAKVLDLGRVWVVIALILCFVATFLMFRSDAMHLVDLNLLSRPNAAVPLTDASYWIGMLIASALGTTVSDMLTYEWAVGARRAALAFVVASLVLLIVVPSTTPRHRLLFYWVNVTVINAAATACGHVLARDPRLGLGLTTSVALTAALLAVLLALTQVGRRIDRRGG